VPLSWQQLLERLTHKRALSRLARWATLQKQLRLNPPEEYRELARFPGFTLCLERAIGLARLHNLNLPLQVDLPEDYDEFDLLNSPWDEEWLKE